jgi:hypothetical protein
MRDDRVDAIPPDWTYNPSTWGQRLPVIALALGGCAVASYLAAYQWDVFDSVWEPFFGDGSETILNSRVSHVLPIPDAALGALGYLADALTGAIGGKDRWRRMPWIVIIFGLAIGPLGAVSILLVILQPVVYDSFCTLCLVSAAISLLMIPPAVDEVWASLQHLQRQRQLGRSLWGSFWGMEASSRNV